jgi:hypothetical protein
MAIPYRYTPANTAEAFAGYSSHTTLGLSNLLLMHEGQSAAVTSALTGGTQYINMVEKDRLVLEWEGVPDETEQAKVRLALNTYKVMADSAKEVVVNGISIHKKATDEDKTFANSILSEVDESMRNLARVATLENAAAETYNAKKAAVLTAKTDKEQVAAELEMNDVHDTRTLKRTQFAQFMATLNDMFEEINAIGETLGFAPIRSTLSTAPFDTEASKFGKAKADYRAWVYSSALVDDSAQSPKVIQDLQGLFLFRTKGKKNAEVTNVKITHDSSRLDKLVSEHQLAKVPGFPSKAIDILTKSPQQFSDQELQTIRRHPTAAAAAAAAAAADGM